MTSFWGRAAVITATILVAIVSVGSLVYQAHAGPGVQAESLVAGVGAGVAFTSLVGLATIEYARWRDRRRRRQYRERPGGPVRPLVPPLGSLLPPLPGQLPHVPGHLPAAPLRTDREAR